VYTGKVERNSDGSFSSSTGHMLSKGPDGQLYSGGAPTGLSVGAGGGVVPTPSSAEGSSWGRSFNAVPVGDFTTFGDGHSAQYLPSVLSAPVYLWMSLVGVLVGLVISSSPAAMPNALGWHPIAGVVAGLSVILAYRICMTWWPTAMVVATLSSAMWAILLWNWRYRAEARALLPMSVHQTIDQAFAIVFGVAQSTVRHRDFWIPLLLCVCVAAHYRYWRHRRQMLRTFGWFFGRGPRGVIRMLLVTTVVSVVIGQLIASATAR
jgi:hypothetical protein